MEDGTKKKDINGSQINILGLTYRVEEVPVVNKQIPRQGEINFMEQVIRIDSSMSDERKHVVLLHEIIHGICEQLNLDDIGDNEHLVQSLALSLHQVLHDNAISF